MPLKEDEEQQAVKKMADLLRQGATLTERACPVCASPLFILRDKQLWCAKCEKKVVIVKEGEDPAKVTSYVVLDKLEETVLSKIQRIQNRMQNEENVEELQKLGNALGELLETLEKIRKTKRI